MIVGWGGNGVERMTFPRVIRERLSEELTFGQDLNDAKKENRKIWIYAGRTKYKGPGMGTRVRAFKGQKAGQCG